MDETLKIIILIIGCYFFGNINNALIISKIKGSDVRKKDSGNPGAMNMIRNFGKPLGALTLFLDVVKGALPCLAGWYIIGELGFASDKLGAYIAAISVITGHIFPVFLRFKGGKGIASSIGVCLVINPLATVITFSAGFIFLALTQIGAVTSFLIISIPIIIETCKIGGGTENLTGCILLFCLIMLTLFAHRTNIKKLFRGDENKTTLFKRKDKQ